MAEVSFRRRKADECYRAARLAFDHDLWETAISRAYYGLFHLVSEVMAQNANRYEQRWNHRQLHNAFIDNFCKRGFLLSRQDGETYGLLREERLAADYGNPAFSQRRAARAMRRAEELHKKLSEVLDGQGK